MGQMMTGLALEWPSLWAPSWVLFDTVTQWFSCTCLPK